MRTPVIAGNWKMYKTPSEAEGFVQDFLPRVAGVSGVEIVLAPPFTSLCAVSAMTRNTNVAVAAQNLHFADEGAYTGEVSPGMVKESGAKYSILGHSERRQYFGETEESVNRKIQAAQRAGLIPILCIGETLAEREAGNTFPVVERQLRGGLAELPSSAAGTVLVAYEPVWAIGTGKTATPDQAQEVHAFLRGILASLWGDAAAGTVRILYGGSVKPGNVSDLMARKDIDGGLVGGASLSPESFERIVKFT